MQLQVLFCSTDIILELEDLESRCVALLPVSEVHHSFHTGPTRPGRLFITFLNRWNTVDGTCLVMVCQCVLSVHDLKLSCCHLIIGPDM